MKKLLLFMIAVSTVATANLKDVDKKDIIKVETKLVKKYDLEKTYSDGSTQVNVKIRGDLAEISLNNGKIIKLAKKTSASGDTYGNGDIEVIVKGDKLFLDNNGDTKMLNEKSNDPSHIFKGIYENSTQKLEISIENDILDAKLNGKNLGKFYIARSASGSRYSNGIVDILLKAEDAIIDDEGKLTMFTLKSSEEKTYNSEHIFEAIYKNKNETLMLYIKNDIAEVKINGNKYEKLINRVSASGEIYSNDKVELLLKSDKAYFLGKEYKRVSFSEREYSGKSQSKRF